MTDIALKYDNGIIDLDLGDGGTAIDDSLQTALIISLFTDRRADPGDELPDNSNDRRGWWADVYADEDGDLIGSHLWLLSREKQLESNVRRAESYSVEALQWLVDDGIVQDVTVSASIATAGVLALRIDITHLDGRETAYRAVLPSLAIDASTIVTDEAYSPLTDEAGNFIFEEL